MYCNFPIIVIGISANHLETSVAVCIGPMYVPVTRLFTLDLSLGFHISNTIMRLVRVVAAFSLCRMDLKSCNDGVINSAPPRLSSLFPNPTPQAVDPSNILPKHCLPTGFSYELVTDDRSCGPEEYHHCCVPCHPCDDTNQDVIINLTVCYNEAAHRLLNLLRNCTSVGVSSVTYI